MDTSFPSLPLPALTDTIAPARAYSRAICSSWLDHVVPVNPSAADDRRVDADVSLVVLHGCPKYRRVLGQAALGQRRHDAARTRSVDAQANIAECECPTDPVVFRETVGAVRRFDHEVWAEARHFKAARGGQSVKAGERCRGNEVDGGAVEERARREREIEHFIALWEPVVVGPVALGGRPRGGLPGQPYRAPDRGGEPSLDVGLAGDQRLAVWERDPDGRKRPAVYGRFDVRGPEIKQARPAPWVFGAGHPAGFDID